MSTPTPQFPPLASNVERRFYPRVAPHAPIFVSFNPFGQSQEGLLLNVSENGLLISTPVDLPCNFVARISIPLNTLPNPVQVTVRVVWANEDRKLAGIQLLDLSEHDRERIRKWAAQESAQSRQPEPDHVGAFAEPLSTSFETAQDAGFFTDEALPGGLPDLLPLAPPLTLQAQPRSTFARRAIVAALVAAVCVAAVLFLKGNALEKVFAHFAADRSSGNATAPGTQDIPRSLENPKTSNTAPLSQTASPQPIASPAESRSALASKSAFRRFPRPSGHTANHGSVGPALIATQNQRHTSHASSVSPSESESETNPIQDLSRLLAVNHAVPPLDPSPATAIPSPAGAASEKNAARAGTSSVADAAAGAPSASPAPSTAQGELTDPMPVDEVSSSSRTTTSSAPPLSSSSSPYGAPAGSPPSRNSDAPIASPATQPVIQPVIHMDSPRDQVLEVRVSPGYQPYFLRLPGERVLQSPSATMYIERSVRIPAAHTGWPFARNRRVVVGGLISRVDPRPEDVPAGSGNSVRLLASVAKNGRVLNLRPILGPIDLVPAALQAVREWRFQPTLVDSKPVETQCYVIIQFHAPQYRSARR
ncbi:MAG: PilZ domain-containing protein [Candidatus Acidiferrum sp.]